MHLKSLTMRGFKSFANPTTFIFEPGVTAVVGPNGSGKSNVVDALAWVMGEQGVKSLRGGKMEDVIFAGTAQRGPLGRAEVTLTIDNADGALPIEYTEVSIRRTLFRNGGSEYAINGATARLLDVQELLSDSGLGREMHVIVGQGQLDAVLRATPEERRGFIEEAAGILKHRRRKEKTLRKLENMQGNLDRLADLQTELRRQLTPLGRQAKLAREAQSIAAVVRDAQARLLADELVQTSAAITDLERALGEHRSGDHDLSARLTEAEARVAELEQGHSGDEVDLARRTLAALEAVLERFRTLRALASGRLSLLAEESESAPFVQRIAQAQVDAAIAEHDRLSALIPAAEEAWRSARSATATARTALDAADAELAAHTSLLSQRELQITTLSARAESARASVQALQEATTRRAEAREGANSRLLQARAAVQALGENPAEPEGADERESAADERLAEADTAVAGARDARHGAERERDALQATVTALDAVLTVSDGTAVLLEAGIVGLGGRVADAVRVEPGTEIAVAAALGPFAEALLAENTAGIRSAVAEIQRRELGRVGLLFATGATGAPAAPAEPTGLALLEDRILEAPEAVRELLSGVLLADSLDQALAAASGDAVIVTIAGERVARGQVLAGTVGGADRLRLRARHDEAVTALDAVAATLPAALSAFEAAERTLSEARAERVTVQNAVRAEAAERSERRAEHARLIAAERAAEAELARLEQAGSGDAEALREAHRLATDTESAAQTARSAPEPLLDTALRDALATELDAARDLEAETRLQAETGRERQRAAVLEAQRLGAEQEEQRAAADAEARRSVRRRALRERSQAVLDAVAPIMDELALSIAEATALVRAAETARRESNVELQRLRTEAATLRAQRESERGATVSLEVRLAEARSRVSTVTERALSELSLERDILIAEYGPEVPVPVGGEDGTEAHVPFSRGEQQRRWERARSQLSRLGQINPLALEEFAALEQRHGFLTEQLADLGRTRADLRTIIADVDEKMQSIFTAAFADTRAAFERIFPILFPGGEGQIFLTTPEEPLGSGIELRVKPAGKKIERLSLLSGGERSLAAIAYLVAIFTARPSPFYILDEVEAALDDANLGRLLDVFRELQRDSQLIIITHQKRTMEIADVLYGVTMRQDGVSAVVGQRLDPAAS